MPACCLALWLGLLGAPPPVDALECYNIRGGAGAVPAEFAAADLVPLDEIPLNGWGHPSLVVRPSARPGRLAALEAAAPLGFSRADADAAVRIEPRELPAGAEWYGVLDPPGLRFRRPARPGPDGLLAVPIPAACLPPGDYHLRLWLRAGDRVERADLPLTIGPYLQRDRFHTYTWNAGGSTEAELAQQIALAKLIGADVLDTAFLPAATALREGLFVSAHYVTIYQGDVTGGHAATDPYLAMADDQARAIGELARRYQHLLWCLPNSEYGSDRMLRTPTYEAALREATGLGFDDLDLDTADYPIPGVDVPALSPGVYAADLPELRAHRFARRHGVGWFELNRRSAALIRRSAPELTIWTDPVFTNEQFEAMDAVSLWHYENDPYQTIAWTQRAACAGRLNGAESVFLTLSQWYAGVTGEGEGWALRSPDQHRLGTWLALTLPVDALGFWEVSRLPDHPDCAAALRESLTEVAYPFGTLLRGATIPPARVAVYLSSDGEFLARAHRPHNYWFHTHYLNGVLPAIYERFGGSVDWLDDGDVTAGRLNQYRLVLCPLFAATTDELLARLREYQAGGGLLAGDELWGVPALAPDLTFPGRSTEALGLPYANESLPAWHRANRRAFVAWRPEALPADGALLEVDAGSPDVLCSLREDGDRRFAVAANLRLEKGEFSRRHGYTRDDYRDAGVAQSVELRVEAPLDAVVYDVLNGRRVAGDKLRRDGDRLAVRVDLPAAGGAILAFCQRPVGAVRLDLPAAAEPGMVVPLRVAVLDDGGEPLGGPTAIRLRVTDAAGNAHDISGAHRLPRGTTRLAFGIPLDAPPGPWRIEARDLVSGLADTAELRVAARR